MPMQVTSDNETITIKSGGTYFFEVAAGIDVGSDGFVTVNINVDLPESDEPTVIMAANFDSSLAADFKINDDQGVNQTTLSVNATSINTCTLRLIPDAWRDFYGGKYYTQVAGILR